MKLISDRETQKRAARFLIVGGTSFCVQVATMKLFSLGLGTDVAFTLAFLCSSATHYTLNRFWALPSARADTWRQLREYLGTVAISWVINFGVFHLCLDVIGLEKTWATAVAVPPSTIVVFLLLNYRVFRAKTVGPKG
ncbi:MAG: GtrA family protein [Verrucomicrobia bacterium]|nr:GtrA family protein [Verrucomicrobiota bacterium]